jgi:hypothetical protein
MSLQVLQCVAILRVDTEDQGSTENLPVISVVVGGQDRVCHSNDEVMVNNVPRSGDDVGATLVVAPLSADDENPEKVPA